MESIRLGNFSVAIPEATLARNGYATLPHGTQYSILLKNDSDRRCDAEIHVDGQSIGAWRLEPHGSARIERPVHDAGKLTFFKLGSPEAKKAGLERSDKLGLVSVEFRPERTPRPILLSSPAPTAGASAGGSGLSGRSDQTFTKVSALSFDPSDLVTIHLRLVAEATDARPLHPRETPVPPPLR